MKNILNLTLVLTLTLTACGNGPSGSAPSPATPTGEAGSTGISLPQSAAYRYDGYNLGLSVGESVSGTYVAGATWTSSNPAVARVTAGTNGSFTVTGLSAGTSLVRGTAGTRYAEMKVTVTAPTQATTVTGVTLSRTALSLTTGSSQTVTATVQGTGSFNPAVTWTSSNAGVASVDGTGRVTAVAAGTATITATSVQDSTKKASLTVTVTAPAPAPTPTPAPTVTAVTLGTSSVSLTTGGSQTVTATVQGTGSFNPAVTWTSSNAGVASVDSGGRVTAVAAGTATITATSVQDTTKKASLTVTVRAPAPTVSTVTLSTATLSLTTGGSQTVTATVQGTGSFNPAVTWSSNNAGVASVDSGGRVTAVATGTATITATSVQDATKKASLTVTVTAPTPVPTPTTDPFNITVVFPANSNLTDGQKAAFTSAAARWSRVIAAGLPDVSGVRLSTGETVLVDDVTIVASGVAIDGPGQIVGQAGPRQVRSGTRLPLWGEMQFDSADLSNMETSGTLQGVIAHEMGHVLGIGTLWQSFLSANATSCASATKVHYTGANGLAQYRGLGGQVAAVPVEDAYGEGTKCGHWKESVFQTELMTGFASKSAMPLSRITLGALADLGYTVNYAAADAYTIPSLSAQALEGQTEIRERLITPDGFIDLDHGHEH